MRRFPRLPPFACLIALYAAAPRVSQADDPLVRVFSAGSLRPAINQIAAAFAATTGVRTQITFGPSGVLRQRIAVPLKSK